MAENGRNVYYLNLSDIVVSGIASSSIQIINQPLKNKSFYVCDKCGLIQRTQFGGVPEYITTKAAPIDINQLPPERMKMMELCLMPAETSNPRITEVYQTNCANIRVLLNAFKDERNLSRSRISDFVAIAGNFLSGSQYRTFYMDNFAEFELALLHLFAFEWTDEMEAAISPDGGKNGTEVIEMLDPHVLKIIDTHRDIRNGVKSLTIDSRIDNVKSEIPPIISRFVIEPRRPEVEKVVNEDVLPRLDLSKYMNWSNFMIAAGIVGLCCKRVGTSFLYISQVSNCYNQSQGLLLSVITEIEDDLK